MSYVVTQADLDILRQPSKKLHIRIELLNYDMKVIDRIEGNLISDNYSIDSESDIRRTYNCELHVTDSTFHVGAENKFWIDRYIRPSVGVLHQRSGEIIWYLLGTYLITDTGYTYDESSNTLSLTCSDLMCSLTADRGSMMEGLEIVIEAGSDVRGSIIGILQDAKIKKYIIEDIGQEIPYDLEHGVGTTYYDLLKEVIDLYAGYEMFFDLFGTFIVQRIPTNKNDIVVMDSSITNPLVVSEEITSTFKKIYNVTQVWGMVIETDHYTKDCSSNGSSYYATTYELLGEYENFRKYGVKIPVSNNSSPTINFNGLGSKRIVGDDGKALPSGVMKANTDYVFKYRQATNDLLLLGQYQAYGEYKQTDSSLPYSTSSLGYELRQILQHDNLESDSLCEQRAKYETWLATAMKDTIDLNMVAIPFLDVNWKISYTSINTKVTNDYIVKSISGSNTDFIQQVTLIRFNELYPDIVPSK